MAICRIRGCFTPSLRGEAANTGIPTTTTTTTITWSSAKSRARSSTHRRRTRSTPTRGRTRLGGTGRPPTRMRLGRTRSKCFRTADTTHPCSAPTLNRPARHPVLSPPPAAVQAAAGRGQRAPEAPRSLCAASRLWRTRGTLGRRTCSCAQPAGSRTIQWQAPTHAPAQIEARIAERDHGRSTSARPQSPRQSRPNRTALPFLVRTLRRRLRANSSLCPSPPAPRAPT
mmetsp:Transcript_40910/g.96280  ORF Transcript_40910/g.96280 Transcript_40910/m.96280 type:complete len:228 (+) Transcript_40910:1341-2024(+)